ncbi:hypothetical protein HNV11_06600 [Spirosoma taeanense]|uniref:DUF5683 domain-containing protein n=1 Tax=Spirosoma taeanense TaxID=2735870 RepID=A0A6M5Y781_9BACT|nr:DUF5683 domain-containing protein [Spirosoma taeanense]QJW89081.1 hypothetical protein HNV11_06600 [Spirosoma taeanense]
MKRTVFFLWMSVGLLAGCLPALGQNPAPAIVPAPTPAPVDSTRQVRSAADTIPAFNGPTIRIGNSELTAEGDSLVRAADTVLVTRGQQDRMHKIIPKQATIRSLILPGLGQAYNRQYYKIPFIYAGFGVMGYLFVRYRGLAKQAEDGYRLLLYGDESSGTAQKVEEVVIGTQIVRSSQTAKAYYDLFRRYRDLNTLLSVVLWGVNAVEANVAAHLKTFDLSDDISMRLEPAVIPMPGTGLVPGVRVALTFK